MSDNRPMISDEAVEAAHKAWRAQAGTEGTIFEYNLRAALEAAAPFIAAEVWDRARAAAQHLQAEAWDEGAKAGADYEYRTALAFERCTLEELTPAPNPHRSQA